MENPPGLPPASYSIETRTYDHLPPFKYLPLNEARQEIRLLTIFAPSQREDSSIVEGFIQKVSLNEKPDYLAVSYVWGAPSPIHKLIVNGEGSGDPQVLHIGTNLNEALRQFRNQEGIRKSCLWIDAICINQTDNDEKRWQVASMKSIYEQAAEVLAWLGPSIDTDKKAFDMLENLESRLEEAGPDLERFKEFEEVLAKDDGSGGIAIQRIIERPWFQRIWIQQEFLAAREVTFVCGEYFCRWEVLFIASTTIKGLKRVTWAKVTGQVLALDDAEGELFGLRTASLGTDMFRMRCDFQGNKDIYSLWDLLVTAKACEIRSTDPRDTIFALLGLASDFSTLGIDVSYYVTPQACFIQASRALLSQGHLRLLWFLSQPKIMKDLPSWVPDWSSEWDITSYITAYCKREIRWDLPGSDDGHFTAGGSFEPSLSFKTIDSRELLVIRGFFYDRILAASAILGNWRDHNSFEYLLQAIELIKNMAFGCTPPVNLDTRVIVRTLLHDIETKYDGHNILTSVEDINISTRLSPELLAKLTDYVLNDCHKSEADLNKLDHFLTIRMAELENRRIFITFNGSLGVGSAWTKPGDVVVVFQGAEVPFILREDCIFCKVHSLVSEAYVHGIMDGELAKGECEACEFQIY